MNYRLLTQTFRKKAQTILSDLSSSASKTYYGFMELARYKKQRSETKNNIQQIAEHHETIEDIIPTEYKKAYSSLDYRIKHIEEKDKTRAERKKISESAISKEVYDTAQTYFDFAQDKAEDFDFVHMEKSKLEKILDGDITTIYNTEYETQKMDQKLNALDAYVTSHLQQEGKTIKITTEHERLNAIQYSRLRNGFSEFMKSQELQSYLTHSENVQHTINALNDYMRKEHARLHRETLLFSKKQVEAEHLMDRTPTPKPPIKKVVNSDTALIPPSYKPLQPQTNQDTFSDLVEELPDFDTHTQQDLPGIE